MEPTALDPIFSHLFMWLGAPGAAIVLLIVLAMKMGWITVKLPQAKRVQDDQLLQQMMALVKENTAAFIALKGTMEDNKGITIAVAGSLEKVHQALSNLSGQFQGAMHVVHEAGHHARRAG